MELVYYPANYYDNEIIEGILTVCEIQELDMSEILDLEDHNKEEFENSFDIEITLSTDQGLNQKMSELYNDLRSIQRQINHYGKQIDRWKQLLNIRKFNVNNFTNNTDEDYDQYLRKEENIERCEMEIDYWNERIEYEKVNALILTIQKEFHKRTMEKLHNENQDQMQEFTKQTEILYNRYLWNVQNIPFTEMTGESLLELISVFDKEYKTQLEKAKKDEIDAINLRNQKYQEIEYFITEIENLISESINNQEEFNDFLIDMMSDKETKYQYPEEYLDENSL